MSDFEEESVAILVAVDDSKFAAAVLQVLRTCAPFPINAAVTNILDHALRYIQTTKIDMLLLDASFAHLPDVVPIECVRRISDVPTVLFADSLTRIMDQQLRDLGAQFVLPRNVVDPVTLVEAVQSVLETHCQRKFNYQRKSAATADNSSASKMIFAVAEDDESSFFGSKSLEGADRLRRVLNEEIVLPESQRAKLRKRLKPPKS
jgi:CheY-like chemotaxis protein